MEKRLKRTLPFCSRSSPRLSSFFSLRASFAWFKDDVWIEIAKYLDGRSLVMLSTTCKWFDKTLSEECVWKFACLRDLAVPDPGDVSFKWKKLYASAFDSSAAIVTEKMTSPPRKIPQKETIEQMLQSRGLCVLRTMKTLDGRHFEQHADGASGAILEAKHLSPYSIPVDNGGVNGGYDGGDDNADADADADSDDDDAHADDDDDDDDDGEEGGEPMEEQGGEVGGEANQPEVGEVVDEEDLENINIYERVGPAGPNMQLVFITSVTHDECLELASVEELEDFIRMRVAETGLVPPPYTIGFGTNIEGILNHYVTNLGEHIHAFFIPTEYDQILFYLHLIVLRRQNQI